MAEAMGNYQLVFPNPRTGEQFDNIKSAWNGLREAAGLKNFRFHDLRHSFASKLVIKGVDLYVVKEPPTCFSWMCNVSCR